MCKNIVSVIAIILFANFPALANSAYDENKMLIIATKEAAPFSIKTDEGWCGISIELWQQICRDLGIHYEFKEMGLEEMLEAVSHGKVDAAVAAITITKEREEAFNFSHPYYTTGLGIATKKKNEGRWMSIVKQFFSGSFLSVVGVLSVILLLTGIFIWFFERKKNPEQFGEKPIEGIGAGFWWAAVTMTTVGYGDKAPVTFGGRLVALVWMFAGLIFISSFTAAITTALTVDELGSVIHGPNDLFKVRVGTVAGSTSEKYLIQKHIGYKKYHSIDGCLASLKQDNIDAVVYDEPIIRYLISKEDATELKVLENTFKKQYYAFAIPAGSPLEESLNRKLAEIIGSQEWRDLLYKYMGQ
ncbi:transporter substrate-binding domain-containing protein [Chloroherpeton thalassium]|nr:transporter substrate-binding domain-containing protein [Chloroherpeton thalassium]